MALYEINLKVYVNYDGTLYNKGSKNVLRPIYKLSNAVYKLSLITPIAPTNVPKNKGTIHFPLTLMSVMETLLLHFLIPNLSL